MRHDGTDKTEYLESIVKFGAAGFHVGYLISRYDEDNDIIRVECDGLWSPEQVDECFIDLAPLVTAMRARCNRVRVFVERRKTREQSAQTAERLLFHTEKAFCAGDRIAVLVDTNLAKSQSRRSLDERTHKVFVSENAAMMWLKAYD